MDKQEQDILEPMTQKVGYGDAEEGRNTGTLVGFVLLNTKECDFERIKKNGGICLWHKKRKTKDEDASFSRK